jgi:hypothetical protein
LEARTRALEQQLELRDQALATLNRRLNALEQADHAAAAESKAEEIAGLRAANAELRAELARLRATKLFRWSGGIRRIYARARGI